MVAALLGLAIYFQAAGAVELVAANVLVVPNAGAAGGKIRRPPRRPPAARATTNGDAILSRNPFDSVTGPLDRTPLEVTVPEPAKASLDLTGLTVSQASNVFFGFNTNFGMLVLF